MHSKKSKKQTLIFASIIFFTILIISIVIYINKNNTENKVVKTSDYNDNSSINGVYVYKVDNTRYEFKEDKTGIMTSGDYKFEYTYTVKDGKIEINFKDDRVRDVKYSYSIEGNTLKLIAEEGTISVGEEYKLDKEGK